MAHRAERRRRRAATEFAAGWAAASWVLPGAVALADAREAGAHFDAAMEAASSRLWLDGGTGPLAAASGAQAAAWAELERQELESGR